MNDKSDITLGIDSIVLTGIEKAIERSSKETFNILLGFVRNVLQLAISHGTIKHFQEYIFSPAFIYGTSYLKARQNPAIAYLHPVYSKQAAANLKEIIWFDIGVLISNSKNIEQKKQLNEFYYWAFNGFSRLFFFIANNGDVATFKTAIQEYNQIFSFREEKYYELSRAKLDIEMQNPEDKDIRLKVLDDEIELEKKFSEYRRHALLGVYYWIVFLFYVGKINAEIANDLLNEIALQYNDSREIIYDILQLRDKSPLGYFEWQGWDYMERPSGEMYHPPYPNDWLTMGFAAAQVRIDNAYYDFSGLDSKQLKNAVFLVDAVESNFKIFQSEFEKWAKLLNVKNKEELIKRCDNVLHQLVVVKRQNIGNKEQQIAQAPLSQEKIDEFRRVIGESWKTQALVRQVFERKNCKELITSTEVKLKIIGQRTFFEKAKMMFIEGEYYQPIYNIGQIGGQIGRWEDDNFFNTAIVGKGDKLTAASILVLLETALSSLRKDNVNPDIIFMSPEHSYQDHELLASSKFVSRIKGVDAVQGTLGFFEDIPIYYSYSNFLNNRVVVAKFNDAFKMRFKTDERWYENELNVTVAAITDEQAEKRLREEPSKWKITDDGSELSDKEALMLIKTSVIIDLWTVLDFQILSSDAYTVGFLKK